MQLFFEVFYLFAPKIITVLFAPVVLVILAFSKLYSLFGFLGYSWSENGSYIGSALYIALFASVGIVLTTVIGSKIYSSIRKCPQPNFTRKQLLISWAIVIIPTFFAAFVIQNSYFEFGYPKITLILSVLALFFAAVGHIALFYFTIFGLLVLLFRKIKPALVKNLSKQKWVKVVAISIIAYPLIAGFLGIGMLYLDGFDNPQASRFFILNAALKNTCFIDPQRENCPHTAEEIGYIEPEQYKIATECCQIQYSYHPEINRYSFVVRYLPTKAIVFDWRFTDETGIDFKEFQVNPIGQDRLVDPPPWDGPWTFPDWKYF